MMCWCRFDQSTNWQIALKQFFCCCKNCIQREKVTSSGRRRHLRSCHHQTIFHAPAKTSTLPICFEISNTNWYQAGPPNAFVYGWWVSLISSNTKHPKAIRPYGLMIHEREELEYGLKDVEFSEQKLNGKLHQILGNKGWYLCDLDTARDQGDPERSCKLDCLWFCPDWCWQFKINSQPKWETNARHFC